MFVVVVVIDALAGAPLGAFAPATRLGAAMTPPGSRNRRHWTKTRSSTLSIWGESKRRRWRLYIPDCHNGHDARLADNGHRSLPSRFGRTQPHITMMLVYV